MMEVIMKKKSLIFLLSILLIVHVKVLQNALLLLGLHIAVAYLGHGQECHQGEEQRIGKQGVIGHVFQ